MRAMLAWLVLGALGLAGCAGGKPAVAVGSYDFPENQLIAEIYAVVLEANGYPVTRDPSFASRAAAAETLEDERIRVAPEYLGSLAEGVNRYVNGQDAPPLATGDPAETTSVLAPLLEQLGLQATAPSPAQDQLAFAVRGDFARVHGISSVSDLAALNGQIRFGGSESCAASATCLPGLQQTYGLQFAETAIIPGGSPEIQNALAAGQVDVAPVFATDPSVEGRGLVVLADDRGLTAAQNIVAVFAGDVPPAVLELVEDVNAELTTEDLRWMYEQVRVAGYPVAFVAANWAKEKGLVPAESVPQVPQPEPPLAVQAVPEPEPEPEPEPVQRAAGFDRNRGEPSQRAKSRNWAALAECESTNRPTVVSSNGLYHGLYQFSAPTWRAVGGTGVASDASPEEQTYRAQILYDQSGPGQWPVCGRRL